METLHVNKSEQIKKKKQLWEALVEKIQMSSCFHYPTSLSPYALMGTPGNMILKLWNFLLLMKFYFIIICLIYLKRYWSIGFSE